MARQIIGLQRDILSRSQAIRMDPEASEKEGGTVICPRLYSSPKSGRNVTGHWLDILRNESLVDS